jgi:hypothetical protein
MKVLRFPYSIQYTKVLIFQGIFLNCMHNIDVCVLPFALGADSRKYLWEYIKYLYLTIIKHSTAFFQYLFEFLFSYKKLLEPQNINKGNFLMQCVYNFICYKKEKN